MGNEKLWHNFNGGPGVPRLRGPGGGGGGLLHDHLSGANVLWAALYAGLCGGAGSGAETADLS